MKYVLMFLAAGTLVVGINLLAQRGLTGPAGLLVFLPVVALTSYGFIWAYQGPEVLRATVVSTFWSVPLIVVFLAVLWAGLSKLAYPWAALAALGAWLAGAYAIAWLRS